MAETRHGQLVKNTNKISLFNIKEDENYNEYDEPHHESTLNEYSGREKHQINSLGLGHKQGMCRSKISNYKQPRGRDLLLGFNTQYGSGFGNYKNSAKL